MSAETIELAKNYTQKRFVDLVRNTIVVDTGIHVLTQEIVIRVTTHYINLYILITKYHLYILIILLYITICM